MKIKIDKNILSDCLKKLAPIASLNKANNVKSNLLLKTQENSLIITASNLCTDASATLECEVKEQGSLLVNASKFSAICETFNEEITLDVKDNELTLSENSAKIKMPVCLELYPVINFETNSDNFFLIEGNVLKSGISKTINFTDDLISITSGVNFNIKNNILKICATNGSCLSCIDTLIAYEGEADFTLSKEFMKLLLKCCDSTEIKICIVDNKIRFELDNFILNTTKMIGIYPKYQTIIDSFLNKRKTKSTLTVRKQELNAVIKQVSTVAQKNKTGLKLECKSHTKISYLDVFSDVIAAKYEGKELEVELSFDLLAKAINALDGSEITLELAADTTPVFICEKNLTLLVAPVIRRKNNN